MNFEVIEVRNVKFANKEKTSINMEVLFSNFEDFIPFTASDGDSTEHGRDLFFKALNKEFGPVGRYYKSKAILNIENTVSFQFFRDRFSKEELVSVKIKNREDATLETEWEDFQYSGEVCLIGEPVRDLLNKYKNLGILTETRVSEILTPIAE